MNNNEYREISKKIYSDILKIRDNNPNLQQNYEIPVEEVVNILKGLLKAILPERFIFPLHTLNQNSDKILLHENNLEITIENLANLLNKLGFILDLNKFEQLFIASVAQIYTDIEAAYFGDPAAKSHTEVIIAYPSILAVSVHRISNSLYQMGIPIIPRVMSEWAHSKTGIDIHPGAQIGSAFFIDHGTGVVIGETTIIGDNVKLYQGVTLGAKSFPRDEQGNPIKGIQRHPTVESNVVIYANTTILGADTVIGENSTIGGNLFITQSIPKNSLITTNYKDKNKKLTNP